MTPQRRVSESRNLRRPHDQTEMPTDGNSSLSPRVSDFLIKSYLDGGGGIELPTRYVGQGLTS